jgi:alkylation response protein AidB-like acyl-CoA dehydrogenase
MSLPTDLLTIDTDANAYLALHGAVDESVTDRLLDKRELEVRRQTRELVATEVAPRARQLDRTHEFAHDSYQALAAAGLAGLIFPERWGGTEDSNVAYAAAMEEITAGCAATSLVYMTQMHAAYPIWKGGSEALASSYVPGLIDGSCYGSLAITEPDAGSDVSNLRTRAVMFHDDQAPLGYKVSGSKTFITTGDRADVIVCFATVDAKRGRDGVTALVIDGAASGLTRGRPLLKMGMHGSSTAELFLTDVEVPVDHRLGREGEGWQILMASVVKSRIGAAAQGVGIARSAYVRALCALHRIHGPTLPDEITFALADLRGEILRGRLLLLSTARDVDEREAPSRGQIGIMKQCCTDLGWRVSVAAAGILGAYGDVADLGVERCLRDAKVTQIYDGTNEVQRLLIGRDTVQRTKGLV